MSAPLSRRRFMALAGGSLASAAVFAACGGSGSSIDTAKFGSGDAGILNYLLTLEYLEVALYAELAKGGLFSGQAKVTLGEFGEEEEEHVSALSKAIEKLGGKPVAEPAADFSLDGESGALETTSELENLGAAAYLGQLTKIQSESALETVLSIHSVEGRHAAAIAFLQKKPATPDGAFAKPATMDSVLESAEPFLAG